MAQKNINIGSSANKGDGDPLRTAFSKAEDNFTELYSRLVTVEAQSGIANPGGAVIQQSIIGSVIGEDSTTIIDHATSTIIANKITGDLTGSVVADDSTVLIDGVSGTINAGALTGALPAIDGSSLTGVLTGSNTGVTNYNGATLNFVSTTFNGLDFSDLGTTPTTLAGYGITDGLQLGTSSTTALAGDTALFSGAFADLTSKPTTIAGYGITDATSTASPAFTGAVDFTGATSVDFTGATISGTSFLTSYTETDPVVGAITGIVKADGSGNISAAVAGTDYLTTVAFADLTGKPTTIAGYGITDALALGTSSTTALAGDTTFSFADITSKPTTLAGYGITDAANTSAETTFTADVKFDTGVEEAFGTLTGSTGVVAHDCDNGHVFYHTGAAGDITANFTNLGLTAEYTTNLTVIINQGATPYEVTAVQIGGAAQTINWQGGSAPTGNANGIDSFSFTILNDGGSYVVLGQMVDFT